MTPGSSRTTASSSASAAGSPPDSTKSPSDISRKLPLLDHPLVDALEAAADDDRARPCREMAHETLGQPLAARAHEQPRADMLRLVDGRGQHIGLHHHAGSAARRCIIDSAMPVGRRIADVAHIERPYAGFAAPCRRANAERSRKHLREQRQYGRVPAHLPQILPSSRYLGQIEDDHAFGEIDLRHKGLGERNEHRFSLSLRDLTSRRSPAPKFGTATTFPNGSPSESTTSGR